MLSATPFRAGSPSMPSMAMNFTLPSLQPLSGKLTLPINPSPILAPQGEIPLSSDKVAAQLQAKLIQNRATKKNGKHLVLDLDETLVHTFDPKDGFLNFGSLLTDEQQKRIYVLNFPDGTRFVGYIRPYTEDFLRVAFEEFESVGVWSAGTNHYVNLVVQTLFKNQQPTFVMSREQCNELIIGKEDQACRYKPLEIIYHRFPDHNEANTTIVDDRGDICALNCMNNIRVPEYMMTEYTYPVMVGDITLLTLANWFQSPEFRNAKDVRLIKARSPFKL